MKIITVLGLTTLCLVLRAQTPSQGTTTASTVPASTPYMVISRDANFAIWQRETYGKMPDGAVITNNHRYVELATGLNHLVNGQYVPSTSEIDISPDGSSASATNGQHQVYFPGNIYYGAIKLVSPDGKILQSQPIGLSYYDGSNSVLLAVVTNSMGAILPSGNQVIYTNAFAGLDADLIYTYTKAGFEQDIILREQPPDPASLGLNSQTTRLQVLTEFFNSPQPTLTATTVPTEAGNLEDDSLGFGVMQMGVGKAFLIGANSPSVEVDKRWLVLNGRQFLIEEVPIVSIAKAIDTLPPFVGLAATGTKPVVSKNMVLPPQRLIQRTPTTKFIAKAVPPKLGLVLDYVTVTSQTGFTFQGDTTYYMSGPVTLVGTNTFEGGAVLKYTNGASLTMEVTSLRLVINWLASPYRPVVFTAKDDNTTGESIPGSTGNPTNYYTATALTIIAPSVTPTISNFRIAHLTQALVLTSASPPLYNGQIVNCQNGITTSGSSSGLGNMLFANVLTNFNNLQGGNLRAQNVTFSGSTYLETAPSAFNSVHYTNCIFANITNLTNNASMGLSGSYNGFYNCPEFGSSTISNNFYPFRAVGAGYYYLTNGCNFFNAGTTNIDPVLLSNLQTRTTWPPIVCSNTTVSGIWTPQAQRDTHTPDLGYHYAPIDYAVSGVNVNGLLTLSNGVAVATFQGASGNPDAGISVGGSDQLISVGTALLHNQICNYAAVQEEPNLWGGNPIAQAILVSAGSYFSPSELYARFTDFNGLAGLGSSAAVASEQGTGVNIGGGDSMKFDLRDCRIGPGWLSCDTYQGTGTNFCVNNLFDRGGLVISDVDQDSPVTMYNNLVHNGYVWFDNMNLTYTWTVANNFFDHTTLYYGGSGLAEDHNGYWGTTQLTPTNANDVVVTNFIYANGPLGNYYQVSTNLLNAGSTTAAALGLYHYTVQTNLVSGAEVPEGANTVSIGFHYVAVDQYGNPLDSNGDGIPDYIEDANGNGTVDSGEIGWNITGDLGLSVTITRPRNGSILP